MLQFKKEFLSGFDGEPIVDTVPEVVDETDLKVDSDIQYNFQN